MTTKRMYEKRALTQSEALGELAKNKGTHFNPRVVDSFIRKMGRISNIKLDIPLS